MADSQSDQAYNEGWNSYWSGLSSTENPYSSEELADQWSLGWTAAAAADALGY